MPSWVLEVNDAGISLNWPGAPAIVSPGIALLTATEVLLGQPALRQAHLRPTNVSYDFWMHLSDAPLQSPVSRARTTADVVYLHLLDIWNAGGYKGGDVILVTPNTMDRDQLALLLGIAEHCPFQVSAVVDAAVAAGVGASLINPLPRNCTIAYLDVQLHCMTCSVLKSDDGALRLDECRDSPSSGLLRAQEILAGLVADRLIRENRFDPMHDAETEQLLYNGLDQWMRTLCWMDHVAVEIEGRGGKIILPRKAAINSLQAVHAAMIANLQQIVRSPPGLLLVSHRLQRIPGVSEALRAMAGMEVLCLTDAEAVKGARQVLALAPRQGEDVPRFLHLPARLCSTPPEAEADPALQTEADPALQTEADPALQTEADPALQTEADTALQTEADTALQTEADPALQTEARAEQPATIAAAAALTDSTSAAVADCEQLSETQVAPTHLLIDSDAWPLRPALSLYDDGVVLGTHGRGRLVARFELSASTIILAGEAHGLYRDRTPAMAGSILAAGDVLSYGERQLHCIRVHG